MNQIYSLTSSYLVAAVAVVDIYLDLLPILMVQLLRRVLFETSYSKSSIAYLLFQSTKTQRKMKTGVAVAVADDARLHQAEKTMGTRSYAH